MRKHRKGGRGGREEGRGRGRRWKEGRGGRRGGEEGI